MDEPKHRCLIVSDFNIAAFAGYLGNDAEAPCLACHTGPFGQVVQVLAELPGEPDFLIVWTQPWRVIHGFSLLMNGQPVEVEAILAEVDQFASALQAAAKRVKALFVPSWVLPGIERGLGMLDLKARSGLAGTLLRINMRLMEALEKFSNIFVLDAGRWCQLAGKNAFNPKSWYLGKMAFGNEVYKEAVRDVKAALRGLAGQARKLIVLDLDDTLWGDIVGDVGWENLQLGGHDATGEAYADFQQALKALRNRGILLGIVSKNEESVALAAIDEHPEMVLRRDDFAGWRINWGDKARNIAELVSELNLGLQSVVFIDDNPAERQRIRDTLPEVLVPDWPEDKLLYREALSRLACFDVPAISQEDLERTSMYVAERKRAGVLSEVGSVDEWLESLEIRITIAELGERHLARATQLFNKTNQMNLSTRRLTEAELTAWAQQPGHKFWVVRVADKFGDYGLTGIVSLEAEGRQGRIVDFILSCRVMGRKVEETMLAHAIRVAAEMGVEQVRAEYLPTAKNKPCLSFFESSGLRRDGDVFSWDTQETYPQPAQVSVEVEAA